MASNFVVLVAPDAQVTDEHRLAVGRESLETAQSLDQLAVLTRKLYFTLLPNPADVERIGDLGAALNPADLESGVTHTHCWLTAMQTVNPTDEFIIGLGKWLYSLRDPEASMAVGSLSAG